MNKNIPIIGVPILNPNKKLYRCQKGHETPLETRWQFQIPVGQPYNGQQQMMVIQGQPCCLVCLVEWAAATFPIEEVVVDKGDV